MLVFGWLAIQKKENWADHEQLLRSIFSCLQGQKKVAQNEAEKNITKFLENLIMNFK